MFFVTGSSGLSCTKDHLMCCCCCWQKGHLSCTNLPQFLPVGFLWLLCPAYNYSNSRNVGIWYKLTHTHPFHGPLSGTTWVSRYQKGKTSLDFTEARDSEWAICKSAVLSYQIAMPAPHLSNKLNEHELWHRQYWLLIRWTALTCAVRPTTKLLTWYAMPSVQFTFWFRALPPRLAYVWVKSGYRIQRGAGGFTLRLSE